MTRRAQVVLFVVLTVMTTGVFRVSAAGRVEGSTIKGVAMTALHQPLPDFFLRLRSLDTARLVKVARTDSAGSYEFSNIDPGTYYVEILDRANRVISTDGPITVAKNGVTNHALRTTLVSAAALSAAGAVAVVVLSGSAPATFQSSAPAVVDAAAVAGIKDGVTQGNRVLPSQPK